MHIIVCIKSVIRTAPEGVGRRSPDNSELNPFDRPALEAALSLKAASGGSVTALSMGPAVALEALSEAQAMGVDRAVLISDPALAGSDTLVTARVLAAGIARLAPYACVLFGARSSDSDTGQVGPQTATVLGIPFVGGVRDIRSQDNPWRIQRVLDDWEESWEVRPPAALTVHPRAFQPRAIPLAGIARAYDRMDAQTWGLPDVGLCAEQTGLAGSPTRVAGLQKIRRKRTCRMIEGEPQEQVQALIEQLTTQGIIGS
ncbi:MAG: electron transfer flavoprotein subunit beta/FixA family protein [Desulfobacteraceae bacterium]|nr:MAG: electron transfer flavoprotein subunit beta/FixA family protein [Desulfobacteraceae bacterium]